MPVDIAAGSPVVTPPSRPRRPSASASESTAHSSPMTRAIMLRVGPWRRGHGSWLSVETTGFEVDPADHTTDEHQATYELGVE
jgi:hypothetical protein